MEKSVTSETISLALAVGLFAAASQFAGAQEPKPWRHGVLDAKSDAGFSFMVDQGFAEKQGLKLKLFQFKSDTHLLQALLAGELDSFEGGPGNSIMAVARGADVKILGCTWPGLPNVILARGLTSVHDLKGRTIAVGPSGSLPDLLVRVLMDQNDIPASTVQFSSVGNDHDRYKALVGRIVDIAVVANEFIPLMEQQGLRLLAAANDFAPNFVRMCIQSTTKTLAIRGDDAAHFMAAQISALRYAVSHRDQTTELTRRMAHEKEDDPRPGFMFDWAVKTQALDPEVRIPADKLTYMQEQLIKIGKLSKPVDVTKMLEPAIREKALHLIGK